MTETLSGVARSLLGKASLHQMPDDAEHEWRHQSYGQMPILTSQWADGHGSRMGGMQEVDLSKFQHGTHHYPEPYESGIGQLLSPSFDYYGDGNLPSDVEMHPPSTAGFSPAVTEGYFMQNSPGYLRPPTSHGHGSVPTQSPKSAEEDISLRQQSRYL